MIPCWGCVPPAQKTFYTERELNRPAFLPRRGALYDHAVHMPAMAMVIIHRHVKHPAVIPDGKHAWLPLQSHYKLILGQMIHQIAKYRYAFFTRPAFYSMGVRQTAIDTFASGIVMRSDQRVLNFTLAIDRIVITFAERFLM